MEQVIPVCDGAEAFIELLNAHGVEYLFLNPGTDTYSVQEAVAKYKTLGKRTPEVILCLDESLAMAAAHGYFMVTGKPQVILVHADLGPQQIGGALHNAQRGRVGVILCAGKVASDTENDRLNQVHWLQDQFDPSGVVRGYVKWEYELRTNENIHEVLQRAFQVASSEPCGPVFLSLRQDLQAEKMTEVRIPDPSRHTSVITPQADMTTLADVADLLVKADNPLVITGYSGRHIQSVAHLIELAEAISARVVSSQVTMNFPTVHPLYGGFESTPYITKADVILVIDEDVPYIPAQVKPQSGTKIIHMDIDAVKKYMPLWGFPVDYLIEADSSKTLPVLNDLVRQRITPEMKTKIQSRYQKLLNEHGQMKEKWLQMATSNVDEKPISPEWLCHCVNNAIDQDTIFIEEAISNRVALMHQIQRTMPGTMFRSGGSNLGWGLESALGAKLASPDKLVVAMVGDGCFVFGCPTASLWAASVYKAPFLCIIFNNAQYTAPRIVHRQVLGPESYCEKTGLWVGTHIKPSPDYAAIAQACNAYGQTVEEPSQLPAALKTAIEQVRNGKPSVLDVRVSSPF